jgi:hypothetical protein
MSFVVAANRRTIQGILATITYLPLCWHNRGSEGKWLEVCRADGPKVRCSAPLLSASLLIIRGGRLYSPFPRPPHRSRAGPSFNHHVPGPRNYSEDTPPWISARFEVLAPSGRDKARFIRGRGRFGLLA